MASLPYIAAALLIALRCDSIAAFAGAACDNAREDIEDAGHTALIQRAMATAAARSLAEDTIDVSKADYGISGLSECHEAPVAEPYVKKDVEFLAARISQIDFSSHGLAEIVSLFQDVIWFVLAFAAYCIWRCFSDMEKAAAEKLTMEKKAPEKSVVEAPVQHNISESPVNVDALVQAMYSDNIEGLRKFLDERSVNACDSVTCTTALHVAAHTNCVPAAEALLARRADVNVCDVWDETPLHFAARAGHVEVCDVLVKNGADVNASNADGHTPLIVAAEAKKPLVCELLLDRGAHTGGADEEDVPSLLSSILQRRIMEEAW